MSIHGNQGWLENQDRPRSRQEDIDAILSIVGAICVLGIMYILGDMCVQELLRAGA